jgi:RNA polymerase subunit RPABC4/transcription elongation factor Spt4
MNKVCLNCGAGVREDEQFCKQCGREAIDLIEPLEEIIIEEVGNSTVVVRTTETADEVIELKTSKPKKRSKKRAGDAKAIRMSGWFWTLFILFIPVVNLICLFVWAFGRRTNRNRAGFARAVLLWIVLLVAILLLIDNFLLQNAVWYYCRDICLGWYESVKALF